MSKIVTREATCSVCGASSGQPVMLSTSSFGYSDLDMRPAPMQRNTMHAWLQECPMCGYVAPMIQSDTTVTKEFLESDAYNTCEGVPELDDLAKRFYRRFLILEQTEEGGEEKKFWALMRAAWACDDAKNLEAARQLRIKALSYMDTLLEKESDEDKKNNLLLIKADVMRRAKLFEELADSFGDMEFKDAPSNLIIKSQIQNAAIAFQIQKAKERDTACYTFADVEAWQAKSRKKKWISWWPWAKKD